MHRTEVMRPEVTFDNDRAPLRVLMVAARYFPFMGGIESHVHEVGRRLAARGHQVCLLTADPTGGLPEREIVEGMEVVRVRTWLPKSDYCLAPGLAMGIDPNRWDIIHVQGYHTFSAPFAMIAALFRKLPFVLTFHSGGHSSRLRNRVRALQYAALRPLVRRAAKLVAVSRFEAEFFSQEMGVPRSSFTVVPNGAHLPTPTKDRPPRGAGPHFVSLGRLERYKGHHRAIEAFAHLRQRFPSATLRVLGEGPYKAELLSLVQRLGLETSVTIGAVPPSQRHQMADLLADTDLVLLLSEYEAHPVAVMEALSLGVSVLTSDTSGFRELAEQGLVTATSLQSSADEIARLMADILQTGPAARNVTLPNWEDCTERLLAVYRSVLRDQESKHSAVRDTATPTSVGAAE